MIDFRPSSMRVAALAILLLSLAPMGASRAEPDSAPASDPAAVPAPESVVVPAHVLTSTCAQPIYPAEALAANITGSVILNIQVSDKGKAEKTDVAESSGNSSLDEAAATGMGQCQFNPATRNGKPVASTSVLRYTFKIDNSTEEEAEAQSRMSAAVAIIGMQKRIDVLSDRCMQQDDKTAAKVSKKARTVWHKHNDGDVQAAVKTENELFANFRSKVKDTTLADEQIEKSRNAIESITDRNAASDLVSLEGNDDTDEATNCAQFNESLMDGKFDLDKVMEDQLVKLKPAAKPAKAAAKSP